MKVKFKRDAKNNGDVVIRYDNQGTRMEKLFISDVLLYSDPSGAKLALEQHQVPWKYYEWFKNTGATNKRRIR